MERILLDGKWKGKYTLNGELPVEFEAKVPGCAHTDLLRAGIIENYFNAYNVEKCRFIENAHFTYFRDFEFTGDPKNFRLVFEGLDTYCDVFLNGQKLGFCDDMFIKFSFDVSEILKNGKNMLEVKFYPPIEYVKDYPKHWSVFSEYRENIRRMQCTFGWDWVDRFVTFGIFDHVWLERPAETEIDCIYIATTHLDNEGAQLCLEVDFECEKTGDAVTAEIISPSGETVWRQKRIVAEDGFFEYISVPEPELWFPNGYGKQPLYIIKIEVYNESGKLISERSEKFGIRTLRILEVHDKKDSEEYKKAALLCEQEYIKAQENGTDSAGFTVLVNGEKIFCKGADWVPCEPFPSDASPEKYRALLNLAGDANVNMLRVWGGGIFEKDIFYEECDRLGILVTQDFLMACAGYPEDEKWFREKLQEETVCAAKRLRNHASLAWWTGDNENGSLGDLETPDYAGRIISHTIFKTLNKLDPFRRFLPSSPYRGKPFKSVIQGISHNTFFLEDYCNKVKNGDLSDYQKALEGTVTRFNNEVPLVGTPAFSSLERFMPKGGALFDEDCLRFHTKNNPSPTFASFGMLDLHMSFSEKVFGKFKDDNDKLFKMQLSGYELIRKTMECYRRNKWYSSGILYWMFDDCWPANGLAIIDYYVNPKAGYYAFKQVARPITVSITEENGVIKLYGLNDSLKSVNLKAKLFVQDMFNTEPLWETELLFTVPSNSSRVVWQGKIPLPETGALLICDAETEQGPYRALYFPKRVQDLGLPSVTGKKSVEIIKYEKNRIVLKASAFAYAVGLDGDYVFSDNFFTMLPGEKRTVNFDKIYNSDSDRIVLNIL